jgi:hypothetical protein
MKKQAAKEGGQLLVLRPPTGGQSVGFSDRQRGLSEGIPPQAVPEVKPPSFALDGGTPTEIDAEKARAALADAGTAAPSMLEEAMAESARGGWGDESKTVPVVGGTEPVWRPVPGKSASEMKAELKTAAERDIQAQPNRFYDPERRVHGLLIDGVRHYLNPSGMMHGIVGRRGAANGAAVARIGTVLNASVACPAIRLSA